MNAGKLLLNIERWTKASSFYICAYPNRDGIALEPIQHSNVLVYYQALVDAREIVLFWRMEYGDLTVIAKPIANCTAREIANAM